MVFYTEITGYYAFQVKENMEKVKVPEDVYIVFIPSNPPPKAIITNDGLRVLKYLQKKEVIELWDKEKEEYKFFIAYSPI